jgi:hypothetical protein
MVFSRVWGIPGSDLRQPGWLRRIAPQAISATLVTADFAECKNVSRIFSVSALSQIQAHPYKEHGNEIRKNLAETRSVGR